MDLLGIYVSADLIRGFYFFLATIYHIEIDILEIEKNIDKIVIPLDRKIFFYLKYTRFVY